MACKLGDKRHDVCKNFPQRQSDIDNCGRSISESTICVARIGGEGCNDCGQCCRDQPWGKQGCPETNYECWVDDKGTCIWYEES